MGVVNDRQMRTRKRTKQFVDGQRCKTEIHRGFFSLLKNYRMVCEKGKNDKLETVSSGSNNALKGSNHV